MSQNVPDFRYFRSYVDTIGNTRNRALIKALYLTASRCNELLTKISPSDEGKTRALGDLIQANVYKEMQIGKLKMPIFTLKIPVLKRHKKNIQVYKMIALPCSNEYEPWTRDLLKWYVKNRYYFCFDMTRQTAYKIVKRELARFDPHVHPHSLRHYRLTHLVLHYNFRDYELSQVAGWTTRTGFGLLGSLVSPNVDTYLHLQWKQYFPKLLVPIKKLMQIPQRDSQE